MTNDKQNPEETLHEIFYAAIKLIMPDTQPSDIHISHRDVEPDSMELDSALQALKYFGDISYPGKSVSVDFDCPPNIDTVEQIRKIAQVTTMISTSYSHSDITIHGPLDRVARSFKSSEQAFYDLVAEGLG